MEIGDEQQINNAQIIESQPNEQQSYDQPSFDQQSAVQGHGGVYSDRPMGSTHTSNNFEDTVAVGAACSFPAPG